MRLTAIYGSSNTGKTYLITKLIKALKEEGLKTAYLKLTKHRGPFDREGKDTYRTHKSGAERIGLVHENGTVLWDYSGKTNLADFIRKNFSGFDFVIIEGNPPLSITKIKCVAGDEEVSKGGLTVAVCSFEKKNSILHPEEDFERIYSIIKRQSVPLLPHIDCGECGYETCHDFLLAYLNKKVKLKDCKVLSENVVVVRVDGKRIEIKSFVQDFLGSTILGALSSLRGFEMSENIEIKINATSLRALKEEDQNGQR